MSGPRAARVGVASSFRSFVCFLLRWLALVCHGAFSVVVAGSFRAEVVAWRLQRHCRMTRHSNADGNHGRTTRRAKGPKTGTLPQSPGVRRDERRGAEAGTGGRHTESRRRKAQPKPSRAKARAVSRDARR